MKLFTAHLVHICNVLDIDTDALAQVDQPTPHMKMVEAIANEVVDLSYEEVIELFPAKERWRIDGEIRFELTERRPILVMTPEGNQTPGNGLPTWDELWDAEVAFAKEQASRHDEFMAEEEAVQERIRKAKEEAGSNE